MKNFAFIFVHLHCVTFSPFFWPIMIVFNFLLVCWSICYLIHICVICIFDKHFFYLTRNRNRNTGKYCSEPLGISVDTLFHFDKKLLMICFDTVFNFQMWTYSHTIHDIFNKFANQTIMGYSVKCFVEIKICL